MTLTHPRKTAARPRNGNNVLVPGVTFAVFLNWKIPARGFIGKRHRREIVSKSLSRADNKDA
jgi:hypothetical protein